MKRIYAKTTPKAFTLIELLVVISIIAALIAIMAIGITAAMKQAKNLRQKVALKAMEVGLELFSKDFDGYPESTTLPVNGIADGKTDLVCGAQHLAEALLGRDERGFEPQTGWYPPKDEDYNTALTSPSTLLDSLYNAAEQTSLNRRKGPYVELKNSGVYTINELWGTELASSKIYTSSGATAINRERSPVITDSFNTNQITLNNATVKVGLPILYFKADSTKRFRISGDTPPVAVTDPAPTEYSKWIYNFDDNLPIVQLPVLSDTAATDMDFIDPASADPATVTPAKKAQRFYEQITQTADATRKYYKPFNVNKFILISAGRDGIYGTKDDITNFEY
jgi:prepilin-type N-terminal cleavage/methylation domain-containing protein